MKENELAIERGLKGEIAEDFISGLKQLFEDHYIDVPDERYDILEAQSDRIAELEEHINSIMEQNIEMKSTNWNKLIYTYQYFRLILYNTFCKTSKCSIFTNRTKCM